MSADETWEVIGQDAAVRPAHWLWSPNVGEEAEDVIDQVPAGARSTLRRESCEVLAQCVPPTDPEGRRTGLVVGYIQSGKTLSFTTVSALARDNGYRLVVVIAGTSVNLLDQTTRRLESDLATRGLDRRWQVYTSARDRRHNDDARSIAAVLADWEDAGVPDEDQRAVLVTVMKERTHLDWLHSVLSELRLAGVPALVIDDEADQASLNIEARQGGESSTYRRINAIRDLLPSHTFLQYTATPQAVLLIEIIDRLSPDFAALLTPGDSYTGGQAFFGDGHEAFEQDLERLIARIPPSDVPRTQGPPRQEPPESLIAAMRLFLVGVAAGLINRRSPGAPRNRSMMVHPHRHTAPQARFTRWVQARLRLWEDALESDAPDDLATLTEEMRGAYNDLLLTVGDLPPFDDVMRRLPQALRKTQVREVNTRESPAQQVPWSRDYAWILVGGQTLDRGFTVEGLTVTYMPRSVGVGNADTVQQRARWFGYKAEYLGYCRVFLTDASRAAYEAYVEHERSVRGLLRQHVESGRPLQELARVFKLAPTLRPTRGSVVVTDWYRRTLANGWLWPRTAHLTADENRPSVTGFWAGLTSEPWPQDDDLPDAQRHEVARDVPLRAVFEDLLVPLRFEEGFDSGALLAVTDEIARALEADPHQTATVLLMRPGVASSRGTDAHGARIKALFQGGSARSKKGRRYPNDAEIHEPDRVTVQIHIADVYKGSARRGGAADLIARDVPVVAVWLPERIRPSLVHQDQ